MIRRRRQGTLASHLLSLNTQKRRGVSEGIREPMRPESLQPIPRTEELLENVIARL